MVALRLGPKQTDGAINAYADWADRLADDQRPGHDTGLRAIFVTALSDQTKPKAFFSAVKAVPGVRFDAMEQRYNTQMYAKGRRVEAVLYVPADWVFRPATGKAATLLGLCDLVHLGPVVPYVPAAKLPAQPQSNPVGPGVVAGIIDDGIAFLNGRFRNGAATRFQAMWIQTLAQPGKGSGLCQGQVLSHADIQARVAATATTAEATIMKSLRRDFPLLANGLPLGLERTVEHAASHGTLVLDAVAGADAPDPMADVPILGVQLPPQSVDDTSGVRLEIHIIQALRWLISEAVAMGKTRLIANISFGVIAGSKDGTRFLEQQIEREIALAADNGLSVDVVLPFGNEYLGRLLAVMDVSKQTPGAVDLILPRADETPSYVEIHPCEGTIPFDLVVQLTAPNGAVAKTGIGKPGDSYPLQAGGVTIGRLYHLKPLPTVDGRAAAKPHLVLAFAPTATPQEPMPPKGPVSLTAPGRWQVGLARRKDGVAKVSLQIQRDDSAFGYAGRGWQAVFEDAGGFAPSALFRDLSDLAPTSAITHDGTNTAYVSRRSQGVHVIGSARGFARLQETPQNPAASYDCSKGAAWSGGAPDVAHVIERTPLSGGWLGAGTASGSSLRLTGTSVAAGLHSRRLILMALGQAVDAGTKVPPQNPDQLRLGDTVFGL